MLRIALSTPVIAAFILGVLCAHAQERGASCYGTLVVEGDPADPVRVFVNGEYAGTAPVKMKLLAGAYDVLLEWGVGGPLKQFQTAIRPEEAKGLKVPARPEPPTEPSGPIQPVSTTIVTTEPDEDIPVFEWALIGGGLTVALAGGIIHYLAFTKNEDLLADLPSPTGLTAQEYGIHVNKYNHDFGTEIAPLATTSYVLYAIGGGAVLTGATLMLFSPDDEEPSPFLQPTFSPEGPGFLMQSSF